MNVYDFDKTIYDGDSTLDWFFYCMKRQPAIVKAFPRQIFGAGLYFLGKIEKTAYKAYFFSFLQYLRGVDSLLEAFCQKNQRKIKHWYCLQKREDDVVISASPLFLIERFCRVEGVSRVIASDVDLYTGKFQGVNCRGEEKVRRFREQFGTTEIDAFYSDSKSDLPLAQLARKAFLIKGNQIEKWDISSETGKSPV
ncbi:HAD-IB family phosphatase [Oscillibacter sp. GMB15532]|uniref:HAD-IB family phosphatase n=1 Tax=Oscillibacter sp. GMB15532 TaxID=3230022 RepID=UPI0034DED803